MGKMNKKMGLVVSLILFIAMFGLAATGFATSYVAGLFFCGAIVAGMGAMKIVRDIRYLS